MKVLQINATLGYSSTGIIAKDIGDLLEAVGDESYYAYQKCLNPPHNSYRVGNNLDWKLHALFSRILGKQAYFSKRETLKLLHYISEVKPDIVHLHNLHSNYIHLNELLGFLGKNDIATVITMHDCWYFTGKCYHYADIGCDKFQKGCGNCPKKYYSQKSLFFDCSKKVLKDKCTYLSKIPRIKLIGCSQWICEEAKRSIISHIGIEQIYNGIDVDIFKPYDNKELKKKYEIADHSYIVMGMANKWMLPENKLLLLETIKLLNDATKLMIVGCTDKQVTYLTQLSENIIPIRFIHDRVELAKHYSLANVFVNVTHADTLPTVNMESICSGTPVITYDSCGSPELVMEGCGKIIQENDIMSMISAISEVQPVIGQKELIQARKRFNKNVCYERYLEAYKEILIGEDGENC